MYDRRHVRTWNSLMMTELRVLTRQVTAAHNWRRPVGWYCSNSRCLDCVRLNRRRRVDVLAAARSSSTQQQLGPRAGDVQRADRLQLSLLDCTWWACMHAIAKTTTSTTKWTRDDASQNVSGRSTRHIQSTCYLTVQLHHISQHQRTESVRRWSHEPWC